LLVNGYEHIQLLIIYLSYLDIFLLFEYRHKLSMIIFLSCLGMGVYLSSLNS